MKQFKIAAPFGTDGNLLLLLFVGDAKAAFTCYNNALQKGGVSDQLLLKIRNLQQQAAQ